MNRRLIGIAVALMIHGSTLSVSAAVIYRGLQNIAIPTDFSGVYLNLDNGSTSAVEFTGWDINPFFGGVGVGNSAAFQPARTGSANSDRIIALGAGATVSNRLLFSVGQGGSDTHLGAGPTRFGIGQEAYIGFRFNTDANAGPYYGWMRVVFTANTPGGVIKDWAYETGGTATQTGNVLQAAPVAGVSIVTLSGGLGQSSTLGSVVANLGVGNVTGIAKTGAGTWTIAGPQTFASLTTSDGITNLNVSLPHANIDSNGGTLNINTSQTLAALNIGMGGVVTLSGSASDFSADAGSLSHTVPEPGSGVFCFGGLMVLLLRYRR